MKNKAIIITGILLLIVSLIIFLLAGYLAGWDFAAWFTSSQAIWIYVLIGLYVFGVIVLLVVEKIKNL
jgi:hypothetical protein